MYQVDMSGCRQKCVRHIIDDPSRFFIDLNRKLPYIADRRYLFIEAMLEQDN